MVKEKRLGFLLAKRKLQRRREDYFPLICRAPCLGVNKVFGWASSCLFCILSVCTIKEAPFCYFMHNMAMQRSRMRFYCMRLWVNGDTHSSKQSLCSTFPLLTHTRRRSSLVWAPCAWQRFWAILQRGETQVSVLTLETAEFAPKPLSQYHTTQLLFCQ